jgi:F-type H+-transporting ATPase subunit epsilon
MATLTVKILSHSGCEFDGKIASLNVPSVNGPLGILPNHMPLMTTLIKGHLVLHQTDGTDTTFAIHGGILDVQKHGVTILTS